MSDFMGDLANLTSVTKTNAAKHSTSKTAGFSDLDMDGFLQLMVAQFQNQDPENAASTTDMLNQMVQMSMITAITNITDAVSMTYSASLVGKEVTVGSYDSKGNLTEIVGTVTGTGTYNGNPVVFVDGVCYNMSSIMAVGRLPETDSGGGTDTDNKTDPDSGTDTDNKTDPDNGTDTDNSTNPDNGTDTDNTTDPDSGTDTGSGGSETPGT